MSPLHQSLIDHQLVPNAALLRLNSSLRVTPGFVLPYPWNLPSRLFQFPIRISEHALYLSIPELEAHPFVSHVQALLNLSLEDAAGYPDTAPLWWHAVDLAIAGRFDDLIRTRDFTTDYNIARAIAYCLQHGGEDDQIAAISTRKARSMMLELGFDEPTDRQSAIRAMSKPHILKPEGCSERWPVGRGNLNPPDLTWALIHGIEDGHFSTRVKGDLQWSISGRDFHAGVSFGLLL